MKRAVIDLGTHSALLLVLDRNFEDPGTSFRVVCDEARICRLGEGLHHSDHLNPEAQERAISTLAEFAALAKAHGSEDVTLIGTAACRRAKNIAPFIREIKMRTGLVLEVASPTLEAQYSYLGATLSQPKGPHSSPLVLDPGGGSTELICRTQAGEYRSLSLPVGSVILTERYLQSDPPTQAEKAALRHAIEALLHSELRAFADTLDPSAPLVALAGTVTTLAAIDLELDPYDSQKVEGYRLSETRLSEIVDRLFALPLKARLAIRGLHPQRAEVILGGSLLVLEILRFLKRPSLTVSDRGLRFGVALGSVPTVIQPQTALS